MTPSRRRHADKMTRDHLFSERRQYNHASPAAKRLRNSATFIVNTLGLPHDIKHEIMKPLTPPPPDICNTVYEIGQSEYHPDQLTRVGLVVDTIFDEASLEVSPERSDHLLLVGYHLLGQVAILGRGNQ